MLERGQDLLRRELAAERLPAVELVEQAHHRVVGAQVAAARVADRRRLEAVSPARHRGGRGANGRHRPSCAPESLERGQRLAVAQLDRLLLNRLAGGDAAAAEPALEEVDVRAREAGERRAKVGVEVAAAAVLPLEAKQRQERLPERGLPQ